MEDKFFHKHAIERAPFGYAHHRIILNDAGEPVDYEFLEVNTTFVKLTGLNKENLIGRTVCQAIPGIEKSEFDWIGYYGKIALEGGEKEFEQYSEALGKWYRVHVYSKEKHFFTTMFTDITERKKAEEALRKSEGILRDIVESTLSGFWDWNLVDNTEYLSPTFKRMFGYEDHEMESSPEAWQRIIFPEDLSGVLEVFDRHVKSHGKEPFYNEVRYRHRDGSTVWVICAGRVIEWAEDGTAIRMVGCHIDITDRKCAEDALSFQNVVLKTQQETSPDGIIVVDRDDRIVSFNQRFAELWGIPDDVIAMQSGEKALNYVLPKLADPDGFAGKIAALYKNRKAERSEEVLLKDGKVLERSSSPMFIGDGHYYGRVWYYRDITARKLAARELRASEEHLAATLRSIGDGVIVCDCEGRVKSINYVAEMLTGWTSSEAAGRLLEEVFRIIHTQTRETAENPVSRAIRESVVVGIANHTALIAKDGTEYQIADSCAPIKDADGKVSGAVLVFRDVTERKRIQAEIEEAKDQYQSLVENIPGITYRCKFDKDWTMLFISDAVDPLSGYPTGDFIGNAVRTYESVIHREDTEFAARGVQEAVESGLPWEIEYRIMHRDGSVRWVHEKGQAVHGEDGSVAYLNGFILDITDRKQNEEKLAALYAETERINRLMIGRENRVIELKKEVNKLSQELKRGIVYKSVEDEIGKK